MSRAIVGCVVLCALAAMAVRPAAGEPPASQPNKVLVKLVAATAKPEASAISAEAWICEKTGLTGLPAAIDCSEWAAMSATAQRLESPRLGTLSFTASATRDRASELLVVELAGRASTSAMLLDNVGQRAVLKLDGLPDGRTIFLAVEVVPGSLKLENRWGPTLNNIRMSLQVEPATWSAAGTVKFVTVFENVSSGVVARPMWASHMLIPLDVFDAKGSLVKPQTTPTNKAANMWFGASQLRQFGSQSATVTGQWDGRSLTVSSSTCTLWRWELPPGQYQLQAVGDMQDYPYIGNRQMSDSSQRFRSQKVVVEAVGPASQPAGK